MKPVFDTEEKVPLAVWDKLLPIVTSSAQGKGPK